MQEQDIPTPAVMVDLPQASRNTRRLIEYLRGHGMKLRPHTKTHKSARLGALQMEWGAEGLAVAKLGEAEVMARVADDVLVGYPALDPARTTAAARLAHQVNLRVAVDSQYAADALAGAAWQAGSTIGILVDLDVGLHRTGVQGAEDALALAQHVAAADGLRLDGLFYYPGHVRCAVDEQQPMLAEVEQQLEETLALWARHGLEARIVSGGSTPTQFQSHHVPATTEIRAGTSLVFDRIYFLYGFCQREDIAARIVATVVSNAAPGKAVIDSGTKALSSDRLIGLSNEADFGIIEEYPDARIESLSEEHGEVDLTRSERVPKLGERIHIIPNHVCPTVNLQNHIYLRHEDGRIEKIPVDARGMLS